MRTIQEFIDAHGLTMESTPVPANPNFQDDSKVRRCHFHCTISNADGAAFMTYYTVGIGVVEQWAKNPQTRLPWGIRPAGGWRNLSPKCVAYAEAIDAAAKAYRPNLSDVLDNLASDAATVDSAGRFEDWADELGFDSDSRRAESIYDTCRAQAHKLRDFLGGDVFESLLYETERE